VPQPRFISRAIAYARDILRSRRLILELTHREFRSRHLGSGLGLLWAFVHPAVMMCLYYIVLGKLLAPGTLTYTRTTGEVRVVQFLPWLLAGLLPWFLISDVLAASASAITDNRFLVKKVVFNVGLIPVIRLLSNVPVHLFLLLAIQLICWTMGYPPCWHSFQILYYLGAGMILGIGWALLVSAIVPFHKDALQMVAVILQIAFWITPLIWNPERFTDHPLAKKLIYLVPTTYIVQGYRDSMVYHEWFWIHPLATAYFWVFAIGMLILGGSVFARLRPHFADVL
jgi:lipopolysaccharide transport system permease protein/teichoic acid transport system permease protein